MDSADYTLTAASPSLPLTPTFSYNLRGVSYTSNVALLFQVISTFQYFEPRSHRFEEQAPASFYFQRAAVLTSLLAAAPCHSRSRRAQGYVDMQEAPTTMFFQLKSTDGARLSVDGAKIIDFDETHPYGTAPASPMAFYSFPTAKRYQIRVEYFKVRHSICPAWQQRRRPASVGPWALVMMRGGNPCSVVPQLPPGMRAWG